MDKENLRKTIYYEFWKLKRPDGDSYSVREEFVSTGTKVIGSNSITTGIDTIPTATLTIPLSELPAETTEGGTQPNLALYIVKIFYMTNELGLSKTPTGLVDNGSEAKYVFIGTVDSLQIDYANYSVTLNLSHRVARMREWVMPTGYTVKNMAVKHILGPDGADVFYSSSMGLNTQVYEDRIEVTYQDGAGEYLMDLSFSSTNKLEALQEVLNNTDRFHFIVDLTRRGSNSGSIIIGEFKCETEIVASLTPFYEDECAPDMDRSNFLTILTEPEFNVDYTGHYNRAVVLCGDIAEGVEHMTLKNIYGDDAYQKSVASYMKDGKSVAAFPVGMYDKEINLQPETEWKQDTNSTDRYNTTKINNEKIYYDSDVIAFACNDNREFYVTDQEQLDKDEVILHTVYNFTDLQPIPEFTETITLKDGTTEEVEYAITDADRLAMMRRAYIRAIRKLRSQRPDHTWQFNCTPLPFDFMDGCKIRLYFTKRISTEDFECTSDYNSHAIAHIDESLHVTKRTITFDDDMNEINTITLDKELRVKDVSDTEYKLTQLAQDTAGDTEAWQGSAGGSTTHEKLGTIDFDPNL